MMTEDPSNQAIIAPYSFSTTEEDGPSRFSFTTLFTANHHIFFTTHSLHGHVFHHFSSVSLQSRLHLSTLLPRYTLTVFSYTYSPNIHTTATCFPLLYCYSFLDFFISLKFHDSLHIHSPMGHS